LFGFLLLPSSFQILPVYPVITSNHDDIDKAVIKIRDEEKEKRQDLHVLAASYWGHLKVRKMTLINEEDFHTLDEKKVIIRFV